MFDCLCDGRMGRRNTSHRAGQESADKLQNLGMTSDVLVITGYLPSGRGGILQLTYSSQPGSGLSRRSPYIQE